MTSDFGGVYPAMPVPFATDYGVDHDELARLANWLAGHDGIKGLVTNGIAGEVFALAPDERAAVTRTVVDAADGRVDVISGIYCERLDEAAEHAADAAGAGASGLLVMPPGRWLRYGMNGAQVLAQFETIYEATGLPLVAHMYPAWTKAAYTPDILRRLAAMTAVAAFKVGTREMVQYEDNIRIIRDAGDAAVLTCQDEFLLASMVQGVDGAMVGFASFVPELITALYAAVSANDLSGAQKVYDRAYPLNRLVYGDAHPNYENYPRMKTAMKLTGRLATDVVRPPIATSDADRTKEIEAVLTQAGYPALV